MVLNNLDKFNPMILRDAHVSYERFPLFAEAVRRIVREHGELLEALNILMVQTPEYKDGDGAAYFHARNIATKAISEAEEDKGSGDE